MNAQNYRVLREAIQKIGLPSFLDLTIELRELSNQEPPEIQLKDVVYQDDCKMDVTLFFERYAGENEYSLSRYNCRLKYYEHPTKDRAYTFSRSKFTPTMREAYNLLQGRSVNKDVKSLSYGVYNAWLTLNFRDKDSNGNYKLHYFPTENGYQIEKILEMYPIRELSDKDLKTTLVLSLKSGDCCLVTLDRARKSEKVYIEAIPRLKTIGIYPIKVIH